MKYTYHYCAAIKTPSRSIMNVGRIIEFPKRVDDFIYQGLITAIAKDWGVSVFDVCITSLTFLHEEQASHS
jgi:hypothetical protein